MFPRIHLLNGINLPVSNYYNSVGVLGDYFRKMGFQVIDHPKFIPFGFTSFMSKSYIEDVANTVRYGDILLGHSHGAYISNQVSKLVSVKAQVYLSAAMRRDVNLGTGEFILNYFAPGDDVIKLSRLIKPWGRAGSKGLNSNDPRYININCKEFSPAIRGHHDWFDNKHAYIWAPKIGRDILTTSGVSIT